MCKPEGTKAISVHLIIQHIQNCLQLKTPLRVTYKRFTSSPELSVCTLYIRHNFTITFPTIKVKPVVSYNHSEVSVTDLQLATSPLFKQLIPLPCKSWSCSRHQCQLFHKHLNHYVEATWRLNHRFNVGKFNYHSDPDSPFPPCDLSYSLHLSTPDWNLQKAQICTISLTLKILWLYCKLVSFHKVPPQDKGRGSKLTWGSWY